MALNPQFWRDRRVFITGHTGFKGGWLSLWLHRMGARIDGYSLPPPTNPCLFKAARMPEILQSNVAGDVGDLPALRSAMQQAEPEFIFHLAAQAIVRRSYLDPVGTYTTNVIGTVNVLEAARHLESIIAGVVVTSDKCYEYRGNQHAHCEADALGGRDPYSSSKACAELLTSAFQRSFFQNGRPWIASARAGNIIGGGDWAQDRLVPDFFRALDAGVPIRIRSPGSVRPWQHVLEPVAGYLRLAEKLASHGRTFVGAWNFGPAADSVHTVSAIVAFLRERAGGNVEVEPQPQPHESPYLALDSSKARRQLHWTPRWSLTKALEATIDWHHAWREGADMRRVTLDQIAEYDASGEQQQNVTIQHDPYRN
jgi:CDP-glucose 4,6-dehydratase